MSPNFPYSALLLNYRRNASAIQKAAKSITKKYKEPRLVPILCWYMTLLRSSQPTKNYRNSRSRMCLRVVKLKL